MSKGSPRITIRVPQALIEEIEWELASQAQYSPFGPEDVSAFVVKAIRERIAKRQRSRTRTPAQKAARRARLEETRYELTPRALAEEGLA